MNIGVISDTHLAKPSQALYRLVKEVFADISIILHAGDLTCLEVLEAFSGKKVITVCGNMDRSDVIEELPKKDVLEIHGYRIGLVHGWGSPWGIEDRIRDSFNNVHAIVYGHTHKPANHIKDGILFFNPGAFSGTFLMGRNRTVGILTIAGNIKGTIINL
jgi:putative phosphoesterase